MKHHRPKKSLGQHFLHDENIARKIVDSLRSEGVGIILEVGPGKGALTKYLFAKKDCKVLAVEIDPVNVDDLKSKFPGNKDQIIEDDILHYELPGKDNPVTLIGNFPYNISSQIFFRILEKRDRIREVVCMVQKEVAERLYSAPGNKTYGILSVLLQAYYQIEYLFTVSPTVFYPQPKVFSAVIRLTRNKVQQLDCNESLFFNVVKACFNQRRKTIRNSIRKITVENLPQSALLLKRPEQLNVDQFVELTQLVEKMI